MTDPAPPPRALPPNVFPPERLEVDGLRLRRPDLEDAERVQAAVAASFAELHAWMEWCADVGDVEKRREVIQRGRNHWADQRAFDWLIEDADGDPDGPVLGMISLLDRIGAHGIEIGYWLRTDATGRGIMTRAAGRITELALKMPGIERVEIRCDAANLRSAAVPKRLGYRLAREVDREPGAPSDSGLDQEWVTP